jgi:hypothetical protein
MAQTLSGQPIDVVQFLCDGCICLNRGALDLGAAFKPTGRHAGPSVVGPDELVRFLTCLGAWSVILGSPAQNVSLLGLRLLADNLSRLWPGSIVVHDPIRDASAFPANQPTSLQQAARFLLAGEPLAENTPADAVSVYCSPRGMVRFSEQPAAVQEWMRLCTLARGRTLRVLEGEEDGPAWVAPVQRCLEQQIAALPDLEVRSERQREVQRGVTEAMRFVAELLAQESASEGESRAFSPGV